MRLFLSLVCAHANLFCGNWKPQHVVCMSCQRFFPHLADPYFQISSLWADWSRLMRGIFSRARCLDVTPFDLTTSNFEGSVFIRCMRVGIAV